MISVGLTGGIAGGKSEVSRLLGERGAFVIDADRQGHLAYIPDSDGFRAVVAAFGPEVVAADGTIDRRVLGGIVFSDSAQMKRLTDIVWPIIGDSLAAIKSEQAAAGTQVLVIEAAVLVDAGWQSMVDDVWVVRAPLDAVRTRLQERRNLSLEDANTRIDAQAGLMEAAVAAATLVIENAGSLEDLERTVHAHWQDLQKRAK